MVSGHIRNEDDLGSLLRAFRDHCLNAFRLNEYFQIDITASCDQFIPQITTLSSDASEIALSKALELIGTDRKSVILPPDVTSRLARDKTVLKSILEFTQKKLSTIMDETYKNIMTAIEGTVRYERIQSHKGPIESTKPWNGLLPRYFTPVTMDDGQVLHFANNGWVMNWDSSVDFAARGTLVYLSRRLVAWSDCIKLRYGDQPADSPALWERMGQYCERTAHIFDGVRLDNCHSTPIPAGRVSDSVLYLPLAVPTFSSQS